MNSSIGEHIAAIVAVDYCYSKFSSNFCFNNIY